MVVTLGKKSKSGLRYASSSSRSSSSSSSGGGGGGSSSSSAPQDYRAESYKEIAKDNAEKLNGKVEIKPENVVKSEISGVNQVAIRGDARSNLNRTQVIQVAIDSQAVQKFNEETPGGAKAYFESVKNQAQPQQQARQELNAREKAYYTNFQAPRTVNTGETISTQPPETFRGQESKPLSVYEFKPKPFYATTEGQVEALEKAKIESISYLQNRTGGVFLTPVVYAGSFGVGVVKGVVNTVGFAKGFIETPALNKVNYAVDNVILGGSEFVETGVTNIQTGNIPGLFEQAGELKGIGEINKAGGKLVKGAFVDYGAKMKTLESNPVIPDSFEPYEFKAPNPKDANTFLVPPEYTETFGSIGKNEKVSAPSGIEPVELTPGFYLELSKGLELKGELNKKAPELQAKLDLNEKPKPSGEVSALSPQEILEINRKPAKQTELTNFKIAEPLSAGVLAIQELIKENPRLTEELQKKYAFARGRLIDKGEVNSIQNPNNPSSLFIPITSYKDNTLSANSPVINIARTNSPNSRYNTESVSRITQIPQIRIQNIQQSGLNIGQSQAQGLSQSQSIIQEQAQTTEQTTTQAQSIIQTQAQTTSQRSTTRTDQIIKTETTTKTPNPFNNPKNKEDNRRQDKTFNVLVRKKGRFVNVGIERDSSRAFEVGKRAVQNSASASFKVVGETGSVASTIDLGSEFASSRKESNVYIQKRSNRINTSGEKGEITYKGMFSQKINKNKQGGKIWAL